MLTDDQKTRLDEYAEATHFKQTGGYSLLKDILSTYREDAINGLAVPFQSVEMDHEAVRMFRAATALIEHVESEMGRRLAELGNVAQEMGVDLDELKMRRMIDDE